MTANGSSGVGAEAAGAASTCAESGSADAKDSERKREEEIFMEQAVEQVEERPNACVQQRRDVADYLRDDFDGDRTCDFVVETASHELIAYFAAGDSVHIGPIAPGDRLRAGLRGGFSVQHAGSTRQTPYVWRDHRFVAEGP